MLVDPEFRYYGTCKWFNKSKGYGMLVTEEIANDASETEVFVHHSSIISPWDDKALVPGENVYFNVVLVEAGLEAKQVSKTEVLT